MIDSPRRHGKQGSGVLFLDGDLMLLLRRSEQVLEPGTWGIPGGAVEGDPLESAIREVEEEAGVSFAPRDVRGSTVFRDAEDSFVYTTYVVKMPAFHPELNWESDDFAWVDLDEALAMDLHPGVRDLLEQFDPWTMTRTR